jgi:hypothetical protein
LFSLASLLQNSSLKSWVAAKQRRKRLSVSVYHRPIALLSWSRLISPEFAEFSPDLLKEPATLALCRGDGEVAETGGSKRVWSCNCRHLASSQTLKHQPAVSWGNDPEELNLQSFSAIQPPQHTINLLQRSISPKVPNSELGKHKFCVSPVGTLVCRLKLGRVIAWERLENRAFFPCFAGSRTRGKRLWKTPSGSWRGHTARWTRIEELELWNSLISAVGKKTRYRVRSGMVSKKRASFEKTVEASGLRSGRNRSLSRAPSERLRSSQTHICKLGRLLWELSGFVQ